jgi:hypothetical protein
LENGQKMVELLINTTNNVAFFNHTLIPKKKSLKRGIFKVLIFVLLVSSFLVKIKTASAADVLVTTASPSTGGNPAIGGGGDRTLFKSSANKLLMFYSDSGNLYYKISANDGVTWGSSNLVISNYDIYEDYHFSGTKDSSDNVYLVFTPDRRDSNDRVYCVKFTYSGGTWTPGTSHFVADDTGVADDLYPNIAVSTSGDLWVSYYYDTAYPATVIKIKKSTDGGVSWGSATTISSLSSNSTYYDFEHVISIYDGTNPLIVYSFDQPGGTLDVRYRYFNGTSWVAEATLDPNNGNGYGNYFSLTKLNSGVLYVAGDYYNEHLNYSIFNGSVWSSLTNIETNGSGFEYEPQVTTDGTNAWVLYTPYYDGIGSSNILYRKYNGASWSAATTLTTNGAVNQYPHVPESIAPGGYIPYLYQTGADVPYSIYYNSIAGSGGVSCPSGIMCSTGFIVTSDDISTGGGNINSPSFIAESDMGGKATGEDLTATSFRACAGYPCTLTVTPSITFSVSPNSVNLGTLTSSATATGTATITTTSNAGSGYATTVVADGHLRTAGGQFVPDVTDGAVTTGAGEYGIGLTGADRAFADDRSVTTVMRTVASSAGAVTNSSVTVTFKAAISNTVAAGSYSQVATFISTGTF